MMNKRWEFPLFSFYDVTGMERHLERMAAKGWQLDHITGAGWTYVRREPQKLHYTVAFYPRASAFDPEPSEGQQTFEEFCAHSGWRLAGRNAKLMIFVSEKEDPVPIHTEPDSQLEMMEKISRQMVGIWFLLLAMLLLNLHMTVSRFRFNPISYLSGNLNPAMGLVMTLLGLYLALELIGWYRWRGKARAAAERGEDLPPTHGHSRLIGFTLMLFLAVLLLTLCLGGTSGEGRAMILCLAGLGLMIAAVNGVRNWLKRKKVSREKNMVITLAVDVVLALVLTGGLVWGVISLGLRDPHAGETEPVGVTAEQLTGIPQPGAIREQTHHESLLLAETRFWDMPSGSVARKDVRSLSYRLLETGFEPVYDLCFRELFHEYDRYGDHDKDYDEAAPFYEYRPADPAPWGAEEAWQLWAYGEPNETYLVCWPDALLTAEPSWPLTEAQMGQLTAELKP